MAENDKTSHPHLTDFSCLRGINRQKKQLAPLRKREGDRERASRVLTTFSKALRIRAEREKNTKKKKSKRKNRRHCLSQQQQSPKSQPLSSSNSLSPRFQRPSVHRKWFGFSRFLRIPCNAAGSDSHGVVSSNICDAEGASLERIRGIRRFRWGFEVHAHF